jgi:heme exporter protein C
MAPQPAALKILSWLSFILVIAAFILIMLFTPTEKVMGLVQKVFYFHVSNAWVGMVGFIVAGVVAMIYLRTKDIKWDIIGVAAVEISLIFFLIAIVLGSIWGCFAWHACWTWEPRLSTAAFLELFYAALLLLRDGIDDPERRARFGAIYTLVGVVAVPITFFSIRLMRTIHPVVIGPGSGESMGMTGQMYFSMFFSIFVFSVVFVTLLWHRVRLGQLAQKVEELKLQVTQ